MWPVSLVLVLAVPLSAPFGDAEASALEVREDGSAVLEVTVEVNDVAAAVLVRGVGPVDELAPVALAPRGDGTWGGIIELTTTSGVLLGFELIPPGGGAATISDLYTLVELGVDPAALVGPVARTPDPASPTPNAAGGADGRRWAWLALGAGAGGLALLLVWLWMGRNDEEDADDPDDPIDEDDADDAEPTVPSSEDPVD